MKLPDLRGIRGHVLRLRPFRLRLSTALCLIVVAALVMAYWAHARQASVPWHRHGGMIGWTQASMIARLGEPARTFEEDLPDSNGHQIRRSPPKGRFRTLVFQSFDGTFVAWFNSTGGTYTCFRSTWVEKGNYY
jgi:hypothetical protein